MMAGPFVCTTCNGDARRTDATAGRIDIDGEWIDGVEVVVWECEHCEGSAFEPCGDCDEGDAVACVDGDYCCVACAMERHREDAA